MKLAQIKFSGNVFLKALTFLFVLFIGTLFVKNNVHALSWTYPNFDVEITVNKDTSFTVKETSTFVFTGNLNGLRRDITLHNENKSNNCATSGNYTCGGFEFLTLNSVTVNGEHLDEDDYKVYEVTDEFTSERSFRIEKRLYSEETYVENDEHTWTIEYTVYGGIQSLLNDEEETVPFFYWNVLPEDRGGITDSSKVTINFPDEIRVNNEKALVYTQEDVDFYVEDNMLIMDGQNLSSYTPITVSYEFLANELDTPGSIIVDFINPTIGIKTYFNGDLLPEEFGNIFKFAPSGLLNLEFSRFGYESYKEEVDVETGEISRVDVNLTPQTWMQILITANTVFTVLGLLAIPIAIYYGYRRYKLYGIDENKEKTIIPQFSPPENVRPYLLGSLIDEKVDKSDITGTIIDLAYRGFIKIKELKKGKEYELFKLEGKEDEQLDNIEQKILDILFGKKDSVKTKDLSYAKVKKFFNLKNDIYQEMLDRRYFDKHPEQTRHKYLGLGIALIVFGLVSLIGGSFFLSYVIGNISIFTMGIALTGLGVTITIIASYMPAKTKIGSKVYAQILGFKMYLHTAERYRVQDLKPDEFEKYLSYAVVLGIEKDWAKSFEDIYHQQPEWYEGNIDVLDAYFISSWVRSFNNSTTNQFNQTIRPSSGTGSGGGWSGGGSFGGFSGGGGGGGSSGGW